MSFQKFYAQLQPEAEGFISPSASRNEMRKDPRPMHVDGNFENENDESAEITFCSSGALHVPSQDSFEIWECLNKQNSDNKQQYLSWFILSNQCLLNST